MRIQGNENLIYAILELCKILSVSIFLVGLRVSVFLCQSYLLYSGRLRFKVRHIGHNAEWLLEQLTHVRPPSSTRSADDFASLSHPTSQPAIPSHDICSEYNHLSEQPIPYSNNDTIPDPINQNTRTPHKSHFFIYTWLKIALLLGIAISFFDVGAFFLLDTEGPDVTGKLEATHERRLARTVKTARIPTSFDVIGLPPAFNYVARRLPEHFSKFGTVKKPTMLAIPMNVDYQSDEKWRVNNPESGVYSIIEYYDYVRPVKTRYSRSQHVVFSADDLGLRLHPQGTDRAFRARRSCSDTVGGARKLNGSENTYELCYSDLPRYTSCAKTKDREIVTFEFRCSRVVIRNHARKKTLNELDGYSDDPGNNGALQYLHLNAVRAGSKFNDTSPVLLLIARQFAEFITQYEMVERDFYLDVNVVIIPNFLIIVMGTLAGIGFLLIVIHSVVVRAFNFVPTSNWPNDLLASLTNNKDSLNRRRQKEFEIAVVATGNANQSYKLQITDWNSVEVQTADFIPVSKIE